MRADRAEGALALLAVVAALAGCGDDETVDEPAPSAPERIELRSQAFADGAEIPERFTCDGDDVPPPLTWSGVPAETRELALVMEDPDAPDGTFVHWTIWGLSPKSRRIEQAATTGARQGENSFGDMGWGGPCPPEGDEPHGYEFVIYALREPLGLEAGAAPGEVRDAIADRAIARGLLVGRYGR